MAAWVQNAYWQFFSGFEDFLWSLPCGPSALVYITHPVDRRIIEHCWKLAGREALTLRRSYRRTVRKLSFSLRGGTSKEAVRRSRRAARKLKIIAGRLVRELSRKLPEGQHCERLSLYRRVLAQTRDDKQKIYSLHEPHASCLAKGKAHKKYEFGNKAALAVTAKSGVFVGAESFAGNLYDGHMLPAVLDQSEANAGLRPTAAIVDRGFRGAKQVGGTEIIMPEAAPWPADKAQRQKRRRQNARRAAIEPRIGHLKSDFRLGRNYLRGILGDALNVMLVAAAANLRTWLRELPTFLSLLLRLLLVRTQPTARR